MDSHNVMDYNHFLSVSFWPGFLLWFGYFKIISTKNGNSSFADIKAKILSVSTLSFLVLLIGYSTFLALVIRSNANTPIDENNPEEAVSLLAYLNREQYGDWPMLTVNITMRRL